MKLKYEFSVREIMGDYILIPAGESALAFSKMMTTTEVGAFLCDHLQREYTREELLEKVLAEYEVDRQTASEDLDEFLTALRELDLLTE